MAGRRVVAALALGAALLSATAIHSAANDDAPLELRSLERRHAPGRPCAVCGGPLSDSAFAYRVRGSWVPLCKPQCEAAFAEAPQRYFSDFLPRNAFLFHEDFPREAPLGAGWLLFALYVLSGLLSAGIAGHLAVSRGKPRLRWTLAGLIGSVIALAVLLPAIRGTRASVRGLGKVADTALPLGCPRCAAPNHPSASRCGECGATLSPLVEAEARRAARAS